MDADVSEFEREQLGIDETVLACLADQHEGLERAEKSAEAALQAAQVALISVKQQRAAVMMRFGELRRSVLQRRSAPVMQSVLHVPELLRTIFVAFADDKTFQELNLDGFDRPSVRRPFQLAAVSRWWRSVALSTPIIWSSISMPVPTNNASQKPITGAKFLRNYLQTVLQRSRSHPLSIVLEWKDSVPLTECQFAESLLSVLSTHASRWRCVALSLPGSEMSPALDLAFRYPTPLLESVDVALPNLASFSGNMTMPPRHLPHCPALRKLISVYGVIPYTDTDSEVLSNLTEMSMAVTENVLPATLWALSQRSPNLQKLSIFVQSEWPDEFQRAPPAQLVLAHLSELIFAEEAVARMFASSPHLISLPSLRKLHALTEFLGILATFIERCCTKVTDLTLVGEINGTVGAQIAKLHQLQRIAFQYSAVQDGFFDTLVPSDGTTQTGSSSWPLPRLTTIAFDDVSFNSPGASLPRLIKRRNAAASGESGNGLSKITSVEWVQCSEAPGWLQTEVKLALGEKLMFSERVDESPRDED